MIRAVVVFGTLLVTAKLAAGNEHTSGKLLGLMRRPRVQQELKLTTAQVQQLGTIDRLKISRSKNLKTDQTDSLPANERVEVYKAVAKAFGELDIEAVQLLDPEQALRLSELYAQYSTLQYKRSFRLLSPLVIEKVRLIDSQRQSIIATLKDLEAEVERRRAHNLKDILEHEESLLKILSPGQRTKFKEIYGEIAPMILEQAIVKDIERQSRD